MQRRISDAQLQAGPTSKFGDEVWDRVVPGFGYRKTKPSRAGYFIRYRDMAGKQRSQSIGKYPALDLEAARKRALELLKVAGRGGELKLALTALSAPEGDQDIRLAALVGRYLIEYAEKRTRPRTCAETRRIFEVYVLPRFGAHRITDVDPLDILAFIQEMAKKTPTMANRTHSALSRFWRWLVNQADLNRLGIQHNPFRDDVRGRMQVGMVADIVIFDPDTVAPGSDYSAGTQGLPPVGLPHVMVSGIFVKRDNKATGKLPGQAIQF